MLDALRRGVGNFLAKILLGLLVIAFAVWGVSDVFRGYGQGTLARIGGTEISVDQFRQAYQDEVASISRRLGRRLTSEQAKLLGLENRALSRLIASAAIDAHARDLGLSLSNTAIADFIRTDPAFHGPDGTFSSLRFKDFLRQNGVTEARYIDGRRKEEVRDQLTDTLLNGVTPPQPLIELLHSYREEMRVIEFIAPNFDKLIKIAAPEESKLKDYYEQNKRQFLTPEFRKINALVLTRDAVKARTPVTEDEIKAAYETAKDTFSIPEKRRIQQLSFQDRAAADKAFAELSKARNFTETATKLGFKESDTELGLLTRRDLIDAKVAEAAFALKKGELSRPVEGQFAVVLLRVSDIEPGKQRRFEEVKAEIKDRIAGERAAQDIHALHEKAESERSAGKSLKEIGEALQLPFREIGATDILGKTPEGKPAIEHAEAATIAQAAFGGATGVEAEAVELSDGGYVWFDVLAITPERQKPFEEVGADVKTIYLDTERRKEIVAAAAKLADRLTKGETLQAIAKEVGAKIERTSPVTRATVPQGLTQSAVQQAFALPKGSAASATTADGKSRNVLRVADVTPAPPPTPDQANRLKAELVRQLQTDILAEYVGGLQARYGVTVNQAALKQALGTSQSRDDD